MFQETYMYVKAKEKAWKVTHYTDNRYIPPEERMRLQIV